MDVSRIEAYNPSRINWKTLTAKEIMKYRDQGIEVPNVYYQWAINFLNDVENSRKDDVTYQADRSGSRHHEKSETTRRTATGELISDSNSSTDTTDTTETSEEPPEVPVSTGENQEQPPALSKAETKRKNMADNGAGLLKMGLSFIKDSSKLTLESLISAISLKLTEGDSNSQIDNLEGEISKIVEEAKAAKSDFKNEISKISKDGVNSSSFVKINQLQKELERYGTDGMNMISETEGTLSSYKGKISGETPTIVDAKDFGSETEDIGIELLKYARRDFWGGIIQFAIGMAAITTGNASIQSGDIAQGVQTKTDNTNTSNISEANSLGHEIENLTGVPAPDKNKSEEADSSTKDNVTGETKEADKDIKTSQNDGTDDTDKANINLDELVKRKVRKGEYAQET